MKTLVETKEIPIIDLKLVNITDDHSQMLIDRLAKELDKALSECGTAFLINHGISEEKQQLASDYFQRFVNLPLETIELFGRKSNHGYIKPGSEQFDKRIKEIRHAYNFGTTNSKYLPNEHLPGWRDVIVDLVKGMNRLQSLVLKSLAVALNVPVNWMIDNHAFISDADQFGTTFRFLYYPPIPDSDITAEGKQNRTRCGAHTDYGTFTFLSQDSEGGLEIVMPGLSDQWRRVGHIPEAILINGGEILDIWSEGRYPALKHRVIIPEEDTVRNRGRSSRAFFVHSVPESLVGPLKIIKDLSGTNNENGKYITSQQFLENKFIATYGKPN